MIDFVYQMTIQAAILRLLKSAFAGFGGAIQSVGPIVPSGASTLSFAGVPPEGSGGGEGISTFGASLASTGGGASLGRGLIVPTVAPAPEMVVNVTNNSSNTTMRQTERQNGLGGKEVDIYIEDLVRRGINEGRFDGVMGQSFGARRAGRV